MQMVDNFTWKIKYLNFSSFIMFTLFIKKIMYIYKGADKQEHTQLRQTTTYTGSFILVAVHFMRNYDRDFVFIQTVDCMSSFY